MVNPFPPNYQPPNRVGLILNGSPRVEEAIANSTINVGALIEIISTGKVQHHSTRGGIAEKAFALEQGYQGAIGGQVQKFLWDDYLATELVNYVLARSGDVINARGAIGELITAGNVLYSNGDGALFSLTGTTTSTTSTTPAPIDFGDYRAIAIALDTLNLKTTTTSTTLATGQTNASDAPGNMIRVRII